MLSPAHSPSSHVSLSCWFLASVVLLGQSCFCWKLMALKRHWLGIPLSSNSYMMIYVNQCRLYLNGKWWKQSAWSLQIYQSSPSKEFCSCALWSVLTAPVRSVQANGGCCIWHEPTISRPEGWASRSLAPQMAMGSRGVAYFQDKPTTSHYTCWCICWCIL